MAESVHRLRVTRKFFVQDTVQKLSAAVALDIFADRTTLTPYRPERPAYRSLSSR